MILATRSSDAATLSCQPCLTLENILCLGFRNPSSCPTHTWSLLLVLLFLCFVFPKFFSCSIPLKRSQRLKRASTSVPDALPPPRRSRTRIPAETILGPCESASQPSGNVNPVSPELIQTLVSTVTASILLPAQPATDQIVPLPLSPLTMNTTSTQRHTQSELPGVNGGSVTNLVNGAIASAHASISGERSYYQQQVMSHRHNFFNPQVYL